MYSPASTAKCSAVFPSLSCLFNRCFSVGFFITCETMEEWPRIAATCRKFLPQLSRISEEAGYNCSNKRTTGEFPINDATCRADTPFLSVKYGMLGGACARISWTIEQSPSDDAKCNGLLLSLSRLIASSGLHRNSNETISANNYICHNYVGVLMRRHLYRSTNVNGVARQNPYTLPLCSQSI